MNQLKDETRRQRAVAKMLGVTEPKPSQPPPPGPFATRPMHAVRRKHVRKHLCCSFHLQTCARSSSQAPTQAPVPLIFLSRTSAIAQVW